MDGSLAERLKLCLVIVPSGKLIFVFFELDTTDLTVPRIAGHCLMLFLVFMSCPSKELVLSFLEVELFHAYEIWTLSLLPYENLTCSVYADYAVNLSLVYLQSAY